MNRKNFNVSKKSSYDNITSFVRTQVSKDSAISLSPISSAGSSRNSPVIPNNTEKNSWAEKLQDASCEILDKNGNRDINTTFQFCTLPRKKRLSTGGKLRDYQMNKYPLFSIY